MGRKEGAPWYKKAFYANSMQQLTDLKSEMPTKTAELLGELRDRNQDPVAITGDMSNINSSSNSESSNRKAILARGLHYRLIISTGYWNKTAVLIIKYCKTTVLIILERLRPS